MNGLSERERRLVALAILIALVAAAWLAVAAPIFGGFAARREQRAEAQAALARDARLVAGFGALKARFADLRGGAGTALISAATGAQALEAARARLATAAARSGATLQTLRPVQSAPSQVRLQGCLLTTLPGLIDLLRRLETAPPYAAVWSLSITAAGPAGEAGAGQSPLQACLEVSYSYADLR